MLPILATLLVSTAQHTWDVVVYGSSPAGIAAATAAGELGLRVALYEPLEMIGGMGAASKTPDYFADTPETTETTDTFNLRQGCAVRCRLDTLILCSVYADTCIQ